LDILDFNYTKRKMSDSLICIYFVNVETYFNLFPMKKHSFTVLITCKAKEELSEANSTN